MDILVKNDRCFPLDVCFKDGETCSGWVVALLCNGERTTNPRRATHVEVMLATGSMAGWKITIPYFEGVLQSPTLH